MKNNEDFNTNLNRWTESAIECYNRGCSCGGCPIQSIMTSRCKMKITVLKLVQKLGAPKNSIKKGFYNI